ncbi:acetyl-CoA carboxylase biotin carboxyl carrier protein [Neomegalonema sp.]|uniref:acetyl-CoA carboxylase biotin carboxyl carrier protein n=1 Tax=Neomegalonema sp. TaxID=2039713 RepID=UPI0026364F7E|nr:acetyl-CoA carboxylase biotin carboxyl carrier protein [Neomegalonema sp.]MDD2868207.1 acetyl-CoA carboxylase biotin carboxyl carrier protein [Neomegalonema sp.]
MSKDKTESDVAFIRALAELLQTTDLAEISVKREYGEDDELEVRLSRQSSSAPQVIYAAAPPYAAPAGAPPVAAPSAAPAAAPAAAPSDPSKDPNCVPSPMVGTAYLSPEPGAEAFVKEGAAVTAGQTLIIIEAMKTMNAIPSPRAGVVRRILVADGAPVEYGAPLMIIE